MTPLPADAWAARNTFHAREFDDLDALVALKRRRGHVISVGLPTLNEAATIGRVLTVLRRALADAVPLVDEIAVIDSGSTDGTVEIARSLGITVHRHAAILPEEGSRGGKGEALWKSLHALRGDLIVWVDADIRNIHPRFVYGLLGPLLREPRIGYVKGFYRRPLAAGSKRLETGGGRVTELTARPLLNLCFPELAGVVQPLAGEAAGRRSLLEQLPFFTGYGVETGHLIDIAGRFGLDRIAQVHLDVRVHRNRPLAPLSLMAAAVAQVVLIRFGERIGAPLAASMHPMMTLLAADAAKGAGGRGPRAGRGPAVRRDVHWVHEGMRPPIATVAAYRRRDGGAPPADFAAGQHDIKAVGRG